MVDASKRIVPEKIVWQGVVVAVQPRIRLTRSFDERSHTYLGYALRLQGTVADGQQREFTVGIGKAAQQKHQFQAGDALAGKAVPVADERMEPVEYYKASALKILGRATDAFSGPPWLGVPPELTTYRERGHRRLDTRTYQGKCLRCIWGCRMPVEMIIDQWNPNQRRYRFETFCYGPKSCSLYKAGPTRKVPGRKGMSWEEADWVDDDATAHRGDND